jgi:hypothetical protein
MTREQEIRAERDAQIERERREQWARRGSPIEEIADRNERRMTLAELEIQPDDPRWLTQEHLFRIEARARRELAERGEGHRFQDWQGRFGEVVREGRIADLEEAADEALSRMGAYLSDAEIVRRIQLGSFEEAAQAIGAIRPDLDERSRLALAEALQNGSAVAQRQAVEYLMPGDGGAETEAQYEASNVAYIASLQDRQRMNQVSEERTVTPPSGQGSHEGDDEDEEE